MLVKMKIQFLIDIISTRPSNKFMKKFKNIHESSLKYSLIHIPRKAPNHTPTLQVGSDIKILVTVLAFIYSIHKIAAQLKMSTQATEK